MAFCLHVNARLVPLRGRFSRSFPNRLYRLEFALHELLLG
ncbi:Protein of unknown function [Pyronema omphalodes CBS 100304]|uniref:Uncharacterized protein n=1 Tax=Pyronema omphalodes (strain CBS 100304) TaxID=1076935 RepID=U4LJM7_PYROM|nr:Protein of unknown function [Pyronema omphalodes CBS 100304]